MLDGPNGIHGGGRVASAQSSERFERADPPQLRVVLRGPGFETIEVLTGEGDPVLGQALPEERGDCRPSGRLRGAPPVPGLRGDELLVLAAQRIVDLTLIEEQGLLGGRGDGFVVEGHEISPHAERNRGGALRDGPFL